VSEPRHEPGEQSKAECAGAAAEIGTGGVRVKGVVLQYLDYNAFGLVSP